MNIDDQASEGLRRGIPLWGSLGIAVNGVIGAGIFVLPSVAAAHLGAYSPWIFLICAAFILPIVLSLGRIASLFQTTGGPVSYVHEAFGPFPGFLTGWVALIGGASAIAANTNVLVSYLGAILGRLTPGPELSGLRVSVIFLVWSCFSAANIAGIRRGMSSVYVLTALKIAPLLLLICVGLLQAKHGITEVRTPFPSFSSWRQAAFLIVYAFVGFEGSLVPAGETVDPRKNIPRALLFSFLGSTVLYFLIQSVCASNNPGLSASKAPITDTAAILLGSFGAVLVTLAAVFSILGNLSAAAVGLPRYPYAMAKRGQIVSWFGTLHARNQTPWISILFTHGLIAALAMSGTFVFLAKMAVLAKAVLYTLSIASLARIAGAKAMLGIPLLALVICAAMIGNARSESWITLGLLLTAGCAAYVFRPRARAVPAIYPQLK